MRRPAVVRCLPMLCLLTWAIAAKADAEVPLHEAIDRQIAIGWEKRGVQPAATSDDAEFLRRIHLDLTGRIPTSAQAREFLGDSDPEKRIKLVDRLLGSPEYVRHMQQTFDIVLMERRRDQHVPRADWERYLHESFAANKPWHVLVGELLAADGTNPETRAAAKFYLDRQGETHTLVRDVGRIFLGVNLQCAQCHDHPLVGDYLQRQYYGIFAFLNRSYLFTDKADKKVYFAEKGEGDVVYESVFDPDAGKQNTGPWLLGSDPLPEPSFPKGTEYLVPPAKDARPVPKYSRRAELARMLPRPETAGFSENIVNRLWAHMTGRGLVHPLEAHHRENPPSHPELLETMARWFERRDYDIKDLLREIALSRVYQLSSERPETASADDEQFPEDAFAHAALKAQWAESFGWSVLIAAGQLEADLPGIEAAVRKSDPKFGPALIENPRWRERAIHAKLGGAVVQFVRTFGSSEGQPEGEFQAALDQALFLANSGSIDAWLKPRKGNLVWRLQQLTEADAVAEELYLATLSRLPSADETEAVRSHLQAAEDRDKALTELAWSLIASAEFRFNH